MIERRIRTDPERFAAVLGDRPRARIVIAYPWSAPLEEVRLKK